MHMYTKLAIGVGAGVYTYTYTYIHTYVHTHIYIYMLPHPSRIYHFRVVENRMRNGEYSITYSVLFINSALNKLRFD